MLLLNKHSQKAYSLIVLLAVIVSSCKEPKVPLAEYGPVFQNVMINDNGIFRGFSLGTKMDSVRAKEFSEPVEADDGYLYYEYKMNDSLGSFTIAYDFDDNGLAEIQSDIFIADPTTADSVFAGFKRYFNKHYGNSEDHMGFSVWTIRSEKHGKVRINLNDESADLTPAGGPGKISLWVYPDKD